MNRIVLSRRQISWLLAVIIITPSAINLPQALVNISGQDAVFSQIFPVIYALAVIYAFYWLAKRYPGKNIFEICLEVLGTGFGTVMNVIILLHLWLVFVRDTRFLFSFLQATLLPQTPLEMTALLYFLMLAFYGKNSLETAARINELVFPALLSLLVIMPMMLGTDFSAYRQNPVFVNSFSRVAVTGALSASWYTNILVIGAFMHMIQSQKQLHSAVRHGVLLASFAIMSFIALCIAVFGPDITAREHFPFYSLALQIRVGDFLDRLDLPVFMVYFPSFAINSVVTYTAMLLGLSSLHRSPDYRPYNKAAGLLLLLTIVMGFQGAAEVSLFSNYGLPAVVIPLQIVGFMILLCVSLARHGRRRVKADGAAEGIQGAMNASAEKNKENAPPEGEQSTRLQQPLSDGNQQEDSGDSGKGNKIKKQGESPRPGHTLTQKGGIVARIPGNYRTWYTTTNILLAMVLALALSGFFFGWDYQQVAKGIAFAYGFVFLLAVASSYMETKRTEKEEPA